MIKKYHMLESIHLALSHNARWKKPINLFQIDTINKYVADTVNRIVLNIKKKLLVEDVTNSVKVDTPLFPLVTLKKYFDHERFGFLFSGSMFNGDDYEKPLNKKLNWSKNEETFSKNFRIGRKTEYQKKNWRLEERKING